MIKLPAVSGLLLSLVLASAATAQTPRVPLPIDLENSAESAWLKKPVLDSRVLDDTSNPATWAFTGTGRLAFHEKGGPAGSRMLRIDMDMFTHAPAPTRNRLSSVNLRRLFPGEDWTQFNRLSMWIRPDLSGFPMLPMQIVMHNQGSVKVPDAYHREGVHYVTLLDKKWQHVVWEIEPLARDSVTLLEFGYWVNKMLADPTDRVAFEIADLRLERVEPDHYAGWQVAPGRISFSHTGYQTGSSKTALATDLKATSFDLVRLAANDAGEVVLSKPVQTVTTRFGTYQVLDFSEARTPGRYILRAGDRSTRPFAIDDNVWRGTVWKAANFFFAERCGHVVPGSHGVCHLDWTATLGDKKIVMNGGWHDAGDLSQGLVNTGEATYALFALAERLQERGEDPELLRTILDEAKWGLDWVMKVRFDGGYRIGFAGNNLWTNGIIGDADDRTREARNNPNVNYIAAAAGAIGARVLKHSDPDIAKRSLWIAEDDWKHAIVGKENAETWSTPAFAATQMELASIGILASLELYQATSKQQYADKAFELAQTVINSQQKTYVGREFPLAGFFYTGPDRDTIFHQFHRGNDQAPIVAMVKLCELFPNHADWMKWYGVVALYSEYQKAGARATEPYSVLPAYVYHEQEHLQQPEKGALHGATREAFRAQVLQGMPMGDGYYLKAFPVWFARRGNYGVLLSQAKGLSAAAHLRRDAAAADLAHKQAQWIVGRNPFVQSTIYGEGYDWAQQYNVSSGDMVGSFPVGMQSHGVSDLPYWPSQNTYVYKEVWVHPAARWFWLMQDIGGPSLIEGRVRPGVSHVMLGDSTRIAADAGGVFRAFVPEGRYSIRADGVTREVTLLAGGTHNVDLRPGALDFSVASSTSANGEVTISVAASGSGQHTFEVRGENLAVNQPKKSVTLREGREGRVTWKARVVTANAPWVIVVIPDDDITQREEIFGRAE
jgi:hypothetical protein